MWRMIHSTSVWTFKRCRGFSLSVSVVMTTPGASCKTIKNERKTSSLCVCVCVQTLSYKSVLTPQTPDVPWWQMFSEPRTIDRCRHSPPTVIIFKTKDHWEKQTRDMTSHGHWLLEVKGQGVVTSIKTITYRLIDQLRHNSTQTSTGWSEDILHVTGQKSASGLQRGGKFT